VELEAEVVVDSLDSQVVEAEDLPTPTTSSSKLSCLRHFLDQLTMQYLLL